MTGSLRGIASIALPELLASSSIDVAGVVFVQSAPSRRGAKHLLRKLRKTMAIGPLGAINGLRMRAWYARAYEAYLPTRDIRQICREANVPLHDVDSASSQRCREIVSELDSDYGLSLGNGYIPRSTFSIPRYGMLNVHHERLPAFRGAQSVLWQLYEGSATTGFTIHEVERGLDEGSIVFEQSMPILFESDVSATVTRTYAALVRASVEALVDILGTGEGRLAATPQREGRSFTTPTYWQFLRMRRHHDRLARQKAS